MDAHMAIMMLEFQYAKSKNENILMTLQKIVDKTKLVTKTKEIHTLISSSSDYPASIVEKEKATNAALTEMQLKFPHVKVEDEFSQQKCNDVFEYSKLLYETGNYKCISFH